MQVKIYSNPTKGKFLIDFGQSPNVPSIISVYDMYGKLIVNRIQDLSSIYLADISDQPDGIYLLNISIDIKQITTLIVLNK